MRIVIATPLWPPELGGPANYAKNLFTEFKKLGHWVEVVSFTRDNSLVDSGDLRKNSFVSLKYPSGLRHFLFFCRLLPKLYKADILLALDCFSAGFPSVLACLVLRKPLVLRLEGDFLWESFVERTRKNVTLHDFYQRLQPLSPKESFIKKITGWVIKKADSLVFSSEWRRSMVLGTYHVSFKKTVIILNVWPGINSRLPVSNRRKIVLWAGRMLYLKNLARLVRAFSKANDGSYELHLVGGGSEQKNLELFIKEEVIAGVKFFPPLPRDKLLEKFKEAIFFVLPSLSEVGPNVITEAVATKTPFILTKESGYAEVMSDLGLLVDPLDEDDLAAKIKILMDGQKREEYQRRLESFGSYRDWRESAEDWLKLFQKFL